MYTFNELLDLVEHELKQLNYPQQPRLLYDPIIYSLEEGGKRIRPVATLMACNLFRDGISAAKFAALAVEVFHNFTLLHDDIMDQSDTRRGKPAVHTRWSDNVAILSGDAMMICAYRLLSESDAKCLPQLLVVFNETAIGVCEGQQYDMDFEQRDDVTVEEYLRMIRLKTGVLLAGALQLGAICGEAQPWQGELLYRFGIDVGIAFQLQDDLFDTYGDATVFGKPIGGDILVGKKTFLLTSALKMADATTRETLLGLINNKQLPATEKVEAVRTLYNQLDVKAHTEKAIATYFADAQRILHNLDLDAQRIAPLEELAELLLKRKK